MLLPAPKDPSKPIIEEGAILISEQEAFLLAKVQGAKTKGLRIVRKAMESLWVTGYDKADLELLQRFRKWRIGK